MHRVPGEGSDGYSCSAFGCSPTKHGLNLSSIGLLPEPGMNLEWKPSGKGAVSDCLTGLPNTSDISGPAVRETTGIKTAPLASVLGYAQYPVAGSGGVV